MSNIEDPSCTLCGIVHVGNDFLKGGYVNIPNYQYEMGTWNLNGVMVFVVSNFLELGRDMATCESNISSYKLFVSTACLLVFASSLQVCVLTIVLKEKLSNY